jgi:multisubunit Na+/H+ antiporter MnhG subunit
MRRLIRENGLSIALLGMFLVSAVGQSIVGHTTYNDEQRDHGEAAIAFGGYLSTAHFWESLSENWESEFLQIFFYVFLTAFLYQKGSAESRKLDGENPVDRDPRAHRLRRDAPWPVKRGGLALNLYEHSLSIAFFLFLLGAITLHAVSGARVYSQEQVDHGEAPMSVLKYVGTSRFWFESFQNWQSEFLAIALVVVFSIFLRQRGSPESKPVDSPHSETGSG